MTLSVNSPQDFDRLVELFMRRYRLDADLLRTQKSTQGRFSFRLPVIHLLYDVLAATFGIERDTLDGAALGELDNDMRFMSVIQDSTVSDLDVVACKHLLEQTPLLPAETPGFFGEYGTESIANPRLRFDAFVHVLAAVLHELGYPPVHVYLVNEALPPDVIKMTDLTDGLLSDPGVRRVVAALRNWDALEETGIAPIIRFVETVRIGPENAAAVARLTESCRTQVSEGDHAMQRFLRQVSFSYQAYIRLTYLVMRRFGLDLTKLQEGA